MLVHIGSHRHDPGGEVGEKIDYGFAYSLSCRYAVKCLRLTVPLGDGAGIVHPYQYGGHRVDDVGEVVLETVDLGFGPFSFPDITRCGENADRVSGLIPVNGRIVDNRRDLAIAVAYGQFVITHQALAEYLTVPASCFLRLCEVIGKVGADQFRTCVPGNVLRCGIDVAYPAFRVNGD